jgi:hypothetical protein
MRLMMIEVCFGDCESANIKYGLHKNKGEVIRLAYTLDLGKISKDNFVKLRREWNDSFFTCSKMQRRKMFSNIKKATKKVIKLAKKGCEIRIWYASAPVSRCGFYYLIYLLQGINANIYVLEMPQGIVHGDPVRDCIWGVVSPWDMKKFVHLTKKLDVAERNVIAAKWEKLAKENADMRVNIDGEIVSVNNDYYDDEILSFAPDGEFSKTELVGNVIGYSKHYIHDSVIRDRIDELVKKGKLLVVNAEEGKYIVAK